MQLASSSLLVTGGASGLGRACVERFSAVGAKVVIADLDETNGRSLAATLGKSAHFIATDVTDESSVLAAIDSAKSIFGGLHGVIHCAGILAAARAVGKHGPHDLALFRRVIDINLTGTFNVLRLAAAAIAQQPADPLGERGVLIATSSIAADDGQIGQAAYAAAKAGVTGLILPLAREFASLGIRVVAIAPGVFETAMMSAAPAAVRESLAGQIPFPPRFGDPTEFAALAQQVFENRFLNGTTIRLDGALRMGAK